MIVLKFIFHVFIFLFLTVLTQIGGVIYIISIFVIKKREAGRRIKIIITFSTLYLISTFLIVPNIAPVFGREKIKETKVVEAHSFFYKLANRNYVRSELNRALNDISVDFSNKNKGIKLIYLDANFPFLDDFPLLPHLSHSDGKKLDISLIYEGKGKMTNKKPSTSGYGVYENSASRETNQTEICKERGYWQYDFPKYLTFGTTNKDIEFSKKGTKDLLNSILHQNKIGKVFIEPHLKNRLNLKNRKIRFQGCKAVRHDDHIHMQLK